MLLNRKGEKMWLFEKINKIFTICHLRKKKIFVSLRSNIDNCEFENKDGFNDIKCGVSLKSCKVGRGTYFGASSKFKNTIIGKYCSIGENVKLIYGEHPTNNFVSTHPSFYTSKPKAGLKFEHSSEFKEYKLTSNGYFCEIGNDVWIGSNVIILGGTKIGNGAIIGAGSIITKDVPPYAIVAGIPARVLKYRFDEKQIKALENIKWWDKDYNWLSKHINLFDDINMFISKIED